MVPLFIQQCLMEMTKHAPFLYTTEIENLSQLCYRAFDNSNYDVRCTVAKLLGTVLATTQNPPKEFVKGMYEKLLFLIVRIYCLDLPAHFRGLSSHLSYVMSIILPLFLYSVHKKKLHLRLSHERK